ncbi:MAG: DUF1294 domain-containing protein [Bacteroidaceae bacterium]|nr:DUF1294 domain-containing protein [Bacteroidaceae bacterium]
MQSYVIYCILQPKVCRNVQNTTHFAPNVQSKIKLLLAVIGGSIGAWLGMKAWHHKTMHKKFRYGLPLIILLQLPLVLYICLRH